MQDATVIYNALPNHAIDYFKMIFGLHTNYESDYLYQQYFLHIGKWGNSDSVSEFFLNDNRTSIRLNALIMLFSFGNYAVHALVMLALSFIGQFAFYKTFKSYFPKKELLFAIIIFLAPSILFWTSGVLKEPLAVFLVGVFSYYYFQLFIHQKTTLKNFLILCFSICFFIVLKPYILIILIFPLLLFTIATKYDLKHLLIFYTTCIIICYGTSALVITHVLKKDIIQTIVTRQNDFINLSKGGIFLLNKYKYVRLEVKDSTNLKQVKTKSAFFTIKPHTKLIYWNANHINNLRDTIFDNDNKDSSIFHIHSICPPSGSKIEMPQLEKSFISFAKLIPLSFYNALCKPFFYDSNSITELMASLENLLFLIFFLLCLWYKYPVIENKNLLLFSICIILSSFLLIGLTTTVMGAIVRYKVPFLPFLLMIPLLILDVHKLKKITIINRFLK